MNFRAVRARLTVGSGAKILLATTGPLQGLFDRPGITHEFCNQQAIKILQQDGFCLCAAYWQQYLEELNAGVYWADSGWKNVGHYLEAGSNKGLWKFPSAVEDFRSYFGQALHQARQGKGAKAAFFLGAAAHLVQDLCVPHHARAKLMNGHQQYEMWARNYYSQYAVDKGGTYQDDNIAHMLLLQNSAIAAEFLSWVGPESSELSYHKATEVLLPLAQRTTAGLLLQFFNTARVLRAA